MLLNDPEADVLLDAATKGIPVAAAPLRLREVAAQGWNVLAGDCPLPLAVIRTDIMAANSAWMMAFARLHGLLLAPHGKTTMAPALFARQLADGAWAITVATSQQLQVCLRAGIRRIILANQPMGRAVDACSAALAAHADLELYVLADSSRGRGAARTRRRALQALRRCGSSWKSGAAGRTYRVPATFASALAVARAIDAAPGLRLAGVEAFEGVLPDAAAVSAFMSARRRDCHRHRRRWTVR
jgi:D-serine dehydratase